MAEPTTHPTAPRIHYLDSVRGLAALAVVFYHFISHRWAWTGWYSWASMIFNGSDAVALFFVLSGLVLSWKYFYPDESLPIDGRHYRHYAVNRVVRLMIPFLVAMVGYYLRSHWHEGWHQKYTEFFANQHGWLEEFMLIRGKHELYVPAWTLEVELAASLLLPFLVVVQRHNRQLLVLLGVVWIVLGPPLLFWGMVPFLYGMWITANFGRIQRYDMRQARWYRFRYLLYLLVFALFSLRHFTRLYPIPEKVNYWLNLFRLDLFYFTSLAAALMLMLLINRPRLQKVLSASPLLFLGRISYSVYLVHWFIVGEAMEFWDKRLGPDLNQDPKYFVVRMLTILVGTLLLATVFNVLVERPAIRLGRRLADRLVPLPKPQLVTT